MLLFESTMMHVIIDSLNWLLWLVKFSLAHAKFARASLQHDIMMLIKQANHAWCAMHLQLVCNHLLWLICMPIAWTRLGSLMSNPWLLCNADLAHVIAAQRILQLDTLGVVWKVNLSYNHDASTATCVYDTSCRTLPSGLGFAEAVRPQSLWNSWRRHQIVHDTDCPCLVSTEPRRFKFKPTCISIRVCADAHALGVHILKKTPVGFGWSESTAVFIPYVPSLASTTSSGLLKKHPPSFKLKHTIVEAFNNSCVRVTCRLLIPIWQRCNIDLQIHSISNSKTMVAREIGIPRNSEFQYRFYRISAFSTWVPGEALLEYRNPVTEIRELRIAVGTTAGSSTRPHLYSGLQWMCYYCATITDRLYRAIYRSKDAYITLLIKGEH